MNLPQNSSTYEGGAFHRELSNGKAFGNIHISSEGLSFEAQGKQIAMPLQGLEVKAGGANDRTIFFTHANLPESSLFTGDHAILKDRVLMTCAPVDRQIAQIHGTKKRSKLMLVAILLVCLGGIYGFFQVKEPLLIATAKLIPASWEQKFGYAALYQLKGENHFVDDPEILDLLTQITEPLFSRIPEKRYRFTVHILAAPSINAFALPGGHIVFHSGLLLAAATPDEVAGVLAHEVAHVTLQHGMRQILGTAGIYTLIQAIFGDAGGLIAVIAENSAFLLTQKYSRDYEREADERGMAYLADAGINPKGMADFFNRLLKAQEKNAETRAGDALNFLSTHPTTQERIEHLRQKMGTLDQRVQYISFDLDFESFQSMLRERFPGKGNSPDQLPPD